MHYTMEEMAGVKEIQIMRGMKRHGYRMRSFNPNLI